MLSLRKPSAESIRRFLTAQAKLPFTYAAVGATAETPPAGYVVDRTRIKLGEGEAVFRSANAALRRWEQFRLGWVEAWPPDTPIQPGEVVAVMGRAIGLWWLNACRIVYVVDESGPIRKFGFAYGTLPGHVESGEERFLIEWDRGDEQRVVRHPGLLPTEPLLDPARLPGRAPLAEAIRAGLGGVDAPGRQPTGPETRNELPGWLAGQSCFHSPKVAVPVHAVESSRSCGSTS